MSVHGMLGTCGSLLVVSTAGPHAVCRQAHLEARALASARLLLDGHDLHDLVLQDGAQEELHDLVLLDGHREQEYVLKLLDLALQPPVKRVSGSASPIANGVTNIRA